MISRARARKISTSPYASLPCSLTISLTARRINRRVLFFRATQARAALLANPVTRTLQLYPTSVDAHLSVSGIVRQEAQRAAAEEVLKSIPGVRGVTSEIVVVPRSVSPAA